MKLEIISTFMEKKMSRLKEIRLELGFTQQELGEKIGVKWSKIKDIENNKQKISIDVADKIREFFSIDPWWLITGAGEKSIQVQQSDNNSDTIPIAKLSATASAGGGNHIEGIDVYDSGEVMHIDRGIFKTPPKGKLAMMKVDGYSMTPMLYPDSWLIFEEQKEFSKDGLYILNFDNTLIVKLLQADIISGTIDIISANKDYKSYNYNPNTSQVSFYIIGKVLRVIM